MIKKRRQSWPPPLISGPAANRFFLFHLNHMLSRPAFSVSKRAHNKRPHIKWPTIFWCCLLQCVDSNFNNYSKPSVAQWLEFVTEGMISINFRCILKLNLSLLTNLYKLFKLIWVLHTFITHTHTHTVYL